MILFAAQEKKLQLVKLVMMVSGVLRPDRYWRLFWPRCQWAPASTTRARGENMKPAHQSRNNGDETRMGKTRFWRIQSWVSVESNNPRNQAQNIFTVGDQSKTRVSVAGRTDVSFKKTSDEETRRFRRHQDRHRLSWLTIGAIHPTGVSVTQSRNSFTMVDVLNWCAVRCC